MNLPLIHKTGWVIGLMLVWITSSNPPLFASPTETMNRIYTPTIHSVQVFREGFELSPPILRLNQQDRIHISFDDLDEDLKTFKFTIVHCNDFWEISEDLIPSDYIDGFREENIQDFAYSFNTTVNYIHYSAFFPTQNMRPKISGNFLLKVYVEEEIYPAFIWRIMVVEDNPITIEGTVGPSSFPSEQMQRQQVNFVLKFNDFFVSSPTQELKICVKQNDRWDNIKCNIQPRFFRGNEIDYQGADDLIYNGGNEFRGFDIKSLKYQSERIARIWHDTIIHVKLLDDYCRAGKNYMLEKDINGRFIIRNDDYASDHNTEADYTLVHFTFIPKEPDMTCRFYILGAFNGWSINEASQLYYNRTSGKYETVILLKQGYYNYQYLCMPFGKEKDADETLSEGNHRATENVYTVLVYYRPAGERYDRLINITELSSVTR